MTALREILLDSGLTEEIKWRHPCYTFENSNVVIMARFNNDARLTFVKGVLLKDPAGMLVKVGRKHAGRPQGCVHQRGTNPQTQTSHQGMPGRCHRGGEIGSKSCCRKEPRTGA